MLFLERSCFFKDPTDVGNLISGSSTFSVLKNSEGVSPSVCKASFCTFVTSGALGNTDCWTSVGTYCNRSRAMEHTFLMSALQ